MPGTQFILIVLCEVDKPVLMVDKAETELPDFPKVIPSMRAPGSQASRSGICAPGHSVTWPLLLYVLPYLHIKHTIYCYYA